MDPREKWDAKYRTGYGSDEPDRWIQAQLEGLPRGRLIDIAGGRGRHAVCAVRLGFQATLVDISPIALAHAKVRAPALRTVCRDLEADGLPAGQWDVAVVSHFLDRDCLAALGTILSPGGTALFLQPTLRNLERHTKPSRRFLVAEGEAPGLFAGLHVTTHDEDWFSGRHQVRLIARKDPV